MFVHSYDMRTTNKSAEYVDMKTINKPSAEDVGREFVRQYYTLLNKDPTQVHRFYAKNSIFFHGGPSNTRDNEPAVGQEEINKTIEQLNFIDCRVKIIQVDSQFTVGESVVVQVCGEFSNNGEPTKKFVQTFVLAPESSTKYHVHNDIFRYQEDRYSDEVSDETGDGTIDSECDEEAVDEDSNKTNDIDKLISNSEEETSGLELSDNDDEEKNINLMVNGTSDAGYNNLKNEENGELQEAELEEVVVEKLAPIDSTPATYSNENQENDLNENNTETTEPAIINDDTHDETCAPVEPCISEVEQAPEPAPDDEPEPESCSAMSWAALAGRTPKQSTQTVRHEPKKPPMVAPQATSDAAIMQKNQTGQRPRELGGNRASAGPSGGNKDTTRLSGRNAPDNYQVFIGNLPNALGEHQVREVFSKYGKIVEVRLNPKNFGFVIFDSPEPAEAVLKDGTITIEGQEINIEEKKPSGFLARGGRGGNAGSRGKSGMPGRGGGVSGRGGPPGKGGGPGTSGGGRGGGGGQRGGGAGNGMSNRGRHNRR